MLSETYQKLDALLGSNSEDSLAVYKTRANLTTNSDFEELDDEQKEAKAKEIFSPYVQDGIAIRDEVIGCASAGTLKVSPEEMRDFENLDETSLAGMAYCMSILTVVYGCFTFCTFCISHCEKYVKKYIYPHESI